MLSGTCLSDNLSLAHSLCKKALTESNGDMDKAVEYLREKGLSAAAKKADRVAAEGVVYAAADAANFCDSSVCNAVQ